MPALLVGSVRVVGLALAALAVAAPAARGQSYAGWQVEASLDHTSNSTVIAEIAESPNGAVEARQLEVVRYSVGASRLVRVLPGTSLRFGLSLANRGFAERTTTLSETSTREVDLLYLGAPITLGYNMVNASRGLHPVVEAGVVPELLLREDESELAEYDLSQTGISWLVSAGVKYNLKGGRALLLAPEARFAARDYSRPTPQTLDYRPITVGLRLGVQF